MTPINIDNQLTGTTVEAGRRLQMNFEVTAWPTIPYFARLGRNITFPLMWYEEVSEFHGESRNNNLLFVLMLSFQSALLSPEMGDKLRLLYFFLRILDICKWSMTFVGIVLLFLGINVQKKQSSSVGVKQFQSS